MQSPLTLFSLWKQKTSQPAETQKERQRLPALRWQQEQLSLSPYLATKASGMGTKCYQFKFPATMLRYLTYARNCARLDAKVGTVTKCGPPPSALHAGG